MFGFIASRLVLAPMIVNSAALDTKYLADELDWNAWRVFLAQNPSCVETLPAEKCCRWKILIPLRAFDDLRAGREGPILPKRAGQASHFNK
jgi:hypothetical protein